MTTRSSEAFALRAVIENCAGVVLLNDVPLNVCGLEHNEVSAHATPWVVEGDNELRIVVEETPPLALVPAGVIAEDGAGAVFATAWIYRSDYAKVFPDREHDERLAPLHWAPPRDRAVQLPATPAAHFKATGRPRWKWQDAPVLDPTDPATRTALLAFLRAIHDAFGRRDAAGILAYMPAHVAESRHFGYPDPGSFEATFAQAFATFAAEPDFAVAEFRDDEVSFVPAAGGRVLAPLRADGRPVLVAAKGSEADWAYMLFLASIDGVLQIARTT